MHSHKCTNGHVLQLDFGSGFKLPCPTCGVDVYKFRDHFLAPAHPEEEAHDVIQMEAKRTWTKRDMLRVASIMGAISVAATVGALLAPGKKPGIVSLAPLPAFTQQQEATLPPTADASPSNDAAQQVQQTAKDGLAGIEIQDFKVLAIDKADDGRNEIVRFSFALVNHGSENTPYPNLVIHWKESTAKDVVLRSDQYAHPTGNFTKVTVTAELPKPPRARGIELKISA